MKHQYASIPIKLGWKPAEPQSALVGALLPRASLRARSTIPLDVASYGPSARLYWDALIRDCQPSG